ncbi:MAG: hypothetical protein V8R55_00240, partial [Dysosmobacter sp.]
LTEMLVAAGVDPVISMLSTPPATRPLSDKSLSRFRKRCYEYEKTTGVDLFHECVCDLNRKIAKLIGDQFSRQTYGFADDRGKYPKIKPDEDCSIPVLQDLPSVSKRRKASVN